ncbi:MAG: DUF4293 domain-containing protein [Bacteroidales bacterium]|nr:DUF4293 domain-containing protein [Candidatus Sodaliphilus aphodohippi]
MVIQRIQSVYLFIAAILMAVFAFTSPFTVSCDGAQNVTSYPLMSNYILLSLVGLSAALALVTIFKFKDLKMQSLLCVINIIIIIAMLATVACLVYTSEKQVAPRWPASFPILAILCLLVARRAIKHDIKLLNDSERIR